MSILRSLITALPKVAFTGADPISLEARSGKCAPEKPEDGSSGAFCRAGSC
jgi:hypothetical protein